MSATDEETVENLKKWWSENGPWILGGLALGAAVLFGWRYWTEWQENQLAYVSDRYEELVAASEAGDAVRTFALAEEIRAQRLSGPYAEYAALAVARHALDLGEVDTARRELEWVLARSSDAGTQHVARLRLARVELADGAFDRAAELLQVRSTGRFAPLYAELRGDLAAARGDRDAAVAAYREALAAADDGIADRALIQIKLDNLGAGAPMADA